MDSNRFTGRLRLLFLFIPCCFCMPLLAAKETAPHQQTTSYHRLEKRLWKAKPSRRKVDQLVELSERYIYYWNFQKTDSAAKVLKRIASDLHYETGMADFHYINGQVLNSRYKYVPALEEYRLAIKTYYKKKDFNRLGAGYLAVGRLYMSWGKYHKALPRFYKALGFYEKARNQPGIAWTQLAIGDLFERLEYWRETSKMASSAFKKALAVFKEINDLDGIAATSIKLNPYYSSWKHSDMHYLNQAKAIYTADNDSLHLAQLAISSAEQHRLRKEYTLAFRELHIAHGVWARNENSILLADACVQLGFTHEEIRNKDSAIFYFQKALQLRKKTGNYVDLADAYFWLSCGDTAVGNYRNAYFHLSKYFDINYETSYEKSSSEARAINILYDTEKRQARMIDLDFRQRMSAASLQQQTTYLYILGGGVVMLAVIAGLVFVQLRNRQRNRLVVAERDRVLEEQKALNYRLQALSSQMNPHFIFNSLTSIQRYMLSNDIDNSNRYLGDFSRLMRQTLENSQESTVTLTDELAMLETYLKLEQMRVSDKFDFTVTVDPGIDPDHTCIPTLLIQPYAENAIWHGIGNEKMMLQIHLYRNKDLICCSIDDNGVGRPKEIIQQTRKSFGMSITKARLELINLLEDGQVNVTITDKTAADGQPLGTRVDICFPADL